MKKIVISTLFILSQYLFGQKSSVEVINQNFSKNPLPILIYFYTDWCSYCKIQEKEIEKSKLKEANIYFVKFDAETNENVEFLGTYFKSNLKNGKSIEHNFIKQFIQDNQKITYPYWIILNQNLEIIDKHSGLIKDSQLNELSNKLKMGT